MFTKLKTPKTSIDLCKFIRPLDYNDFIFTNKLINLRRQNWQDHVFKSKKLNHISYTPYRVENSTPPHNKTLLSLPSLLGSTLHKN